MTTQTDYGWTKESAQHGGVPVLTALVVDAEPDARRRVAGLLSLGGWQVHEAADADDALRQAAVRRPRPRRHRRRDARRRSGPALLRRLRGTGSRARFLVVAADPTDDVRAEAAAAGALACLAKPVDARLLLDFLRSRTTGPAAQDASHPGRPTPPDVDDLHDDDLDAELMDRLQEMYVERAARPALARSPRRPRRATPPRVASAAHTLAGTSGQAGRTPRSREVCQGDRGAERPARRSSRHGRLVQLQALAGGLQRVPVPR